MRPEQVREIVRMTVDELTRRKLINPDCYQHILQVVEGELHKFFNGGKTNIGHILSQLSDDAYIDIIFLQYRDGKTLEWIAEYMDRDESTIKRNKKRLMCNIYELMEV